MQRDVDALFDEEAGFWRDVYSHDSLDGAIYRQRRDIAAAWVDQLAGPRARVLELGSGGGLLAVGLAEAGHTVWAADSSTEMVAVTHQQVAAHGVTDRCLAMVADAHAVGVRTGGFDAVVGLGLLPWLHDPASALAEMARAVRPGGLVVVSADNRARLTHLLDPRLSPPLEPVRARVKDSLSRAGLRRGSADGGAGVPANRRDDPDTVDDLLAAAGLVKRREAFVGFGPFTLLGKPVVNEAVGVRIHAALQRRAERGARLLRGRGTQYLVAATRDG